MRIITGKYKGRKLVSVRDNSVRPATDRVKGTIFNVLQSRLRLTGAYVLDVFAGSGSLGFEALSRGASATVFVDDRQAVLTTIERNAEVLGCGEDCILIQSDAMRFIEHTNERFDLIFADPPYAFERIPDIPAIVFDRQLLKKEGFLIIEHAKRTTFLSSVAYQLAVQKEFGNTRLSFFTHSNNGMTTIL